MSEELLQFPCSFPIKIMGDDDPGGPNGEPSFRDLAVGIVAKYAGEIDDASVKTSHSRNGRYLSVTVTIEAKSQEQLDDIYRELSGNERVKVVL